MLKKSTANPEPTMIQGPKGHGGSAPKTVPNRPASEKNRNLISGPTGGERTSSTYKAPRGGESHDPYTCGYTKPGKM